jgi:thymidylate synthase (FAD)
MFDTPEYQDSPVNIYRKIEQIARCCYKSEDRITADSHEKMLGNLGTKGHLAMLEHHNIVIDINESVYEAFCILKTDREGSEYAEFDRTMRYINMTQHLLNSPENPQCRYIVSGSPTAWTKVWDALIRCFSDSESSLTSIEKMLCSFIFWLQEKYSLLIIKPESAEQFTPNGRFDVNNRILTETEIDALPYGIRRHHKMVTGFFVCDRGVSHELVRHRNSFAQESTRYVNYGKSGCQFILPSWIETGEGEYDITWNKCVGNHDIDPYPEGSAESWWFWGCAHVERVYLKLLEMGWTPQQARSKLSCDVKTEVYMSCTLAYWEWFFKMRDSKYAHPQMQELAMPLHAEFVEKGLLPQAE